MRQFSTFIFVVLLVFAIGATNEAWTQPLPCPPANSSLVSAGADVTICPGACATLQSFDTTSLKSTTGYNVDTTAFLPYSFSQGTVVLNGTDDQYSGIVPLPFDFCFFGQKYNSCIIGANGQISFNTALANGSNPWSFSVGIPGANGTSGNSTLNSIMGPFHDIDPSVGGTIRWEIYGQAPCRYFVVSWENVPMFQCNSLIANQQIVLYETTYVIDVFVKDKPICSTWNGGLAITGIQNATGTASYTVAGQNGTQFSLTNKGFRFTPNGAATRKFRWTDLSSGIVLGANDSVSVCPADTTAYELQVTFFSQCDSITLKDTVNVNVEKSAVAAYTYEINYGCSADTVVFTNTSINNSFNIWDFDDATGDTATNPIHVYVTQGTYDVKLVVGQGGCKDSVTQTINTLHPLAAAFSVDEDSVCQGSLVTFTNSSNYSQVGGPAIFNWDFGDGNVSTQLSPTHTYNAPGIYTATLVVTDFVPCSDTATIQIVVDSLPYLDFRVSDSSVCEGKGVTFFAESSNANIETLFWDFSDGNLVQDKLEVLHAFDSAGVYNVSLNATYPICPQVSVTKPVLVRPFPTVNLGPDTTLCLDETPLQIRDLTNFSNPAARWFWTTGDTNTNFIYARHPGLYAARVTLAGCSAADTIEVRKDCYVDLPNAFSPNGDGINDYFLPRSLLAKGLLVFKMTIYNRWGQEVFATSELNGRGWDGRFNGKEQPEGVYIYLIEAVTKSNISEKHQGNLTLIR